MRGNYCHYASSSITGQIMVPISRDIASFVISKLTNKSLMSYDMGKEIHGDFIDESGKIGKIDIFVMPLSDY